MVSGRYAPGERLPSERQLVERYGVSRPIVREVLRSLQERRLITVQPGRGSFVREMRPTDGHHSLDVLTRRGQVTARDLVTARAMLECEAASLAASNRTDAHATRMRQVLAAFDASTDTAVQAALDVTFHETVAVASNNPVIQIMFGSIRALTHAIVLRSLTDREVRNAGARLHHVVLEAILERDAEAARAAMAQHMHLAERYYGLDLDAPLADVLNRRADSEPRVAELLRQASLSVEADQAAFASRQ